MGNNKKIFIIRKYVPAISARDAIQKERMFAVDDVYLQEVPQETKMEPIGFRV